MTSTRAIYLPFALYTLFNFVTMLLEVPTVRIFEHATCVRTLQRSDVNEAECKIVGIQNMLSSVVGWKLTLDACAGLLTAMLYGSVSERMGERLVLALSLGGYAGMQLIDILICSFPLVFPIQTVWFSSLLLLVGGGQRIFNSMIFTLVSNALDDTNRTTFLYWLAFGPHCMRFIAPRIAAGLMGVGLLAPFYLGICMLALMVLIIPFVVESRCHAPQRVPSSEYVPIRESPELHPSPSGRTSSRSSSEQSLSPRIISRQTTDESPSLQTSNDLVRYRVSAFFQAKFHDTMALLRAPKTLFCLITVFLKRIGFSSSVFAFQYVSERFGWQLQETTWLRVISGAGAIAIGILAPTTTARFVRRGAYPPRVDLHSIRAALAILSVSFFATWKATGTTMILLSMFGIGFGEGLEPALQGFVTFAAGEISSSRVFTTYAFFDAAAELTAGPLVARLMAIGRTEDHPSEGMCFLASSSIFACLLSWAWVIEVSRPRS